MLFRNIESLMTKVTSVFETSHKKGEKNVKKYIVS